jgi:AbrB family looped-hinge helix DNA binding protein
MSIEAILTSKGQVTIPKEIRDSLHMKEGDRMKFTLLPTGVRVAAVTLLTPVLRGRGCPARRAA